MNIKDLLKEISFKAVINDLNFSSCLYIKPNTSKLYVILNGALIKEPRNPLIYHRHSWHLEFDGSVLYIADPTLFKYESINLAWYVGDKDTDLYPYLAEFVTSVATHLNVETDHIVTYGSSGGGFAALQLGARIGNGVVTVCINPQTNIMKYVPSYRNAFLNACFDFNAEEYDSLSNQEKFNALVLLKENTSKILYIQNTQDEFHHKWHFLPFLELKGIDLSEIEKTHWREQQSKDVKVILYSHESGHAAEPKEMIPEILSAVDQLIAS
ncbi:TPA: hypothetical protein PW671_001717 [Mannheimia haemolytica]|uniref:hypothetical protein n=1 Tax=Mannheimia haemolytica TaxID=75985 RepID=UPI00035838A9|nr:hypothetical protein [Mannheimia haemolytica]AGQ25922.1 hypothetical protein F382_08100 [Mannheimia haemolytica D153]QEB19098.1 hypothetical protein BG609_13560 [Mannheimia haemolytica]QEB96676.1 hypothetical protein BG584_13600 [Mannheimia haemolytica]UQX79845.1 hypothetical protein M3703_00320 [Mannheimia haemolytica]HDL1986720.1 hypothetical protein [Mannheimia haemolytica]